MLSLSLDCSQLQSNIASAHLSLAERAKVEGDEHAEQDPEVGGEESASFKKQFPPLSSSQTVEPSKTIKKRKTAPEATTNEGGDRSKGKKRKGKK